MQQVWAACRARQSEIIGAAAHLSTTVSPGAGLPFCSSDLLLPGISSVGGAVSTTAAADQAVPLRRQHTHARRMRVPPQSRSVGSCG